MPLSGDRIDRIGLHGNGAGIFPSPGNLHLHFRAVPPLRVPGGEPRSKQEILIAFERPIQERERARMTYGPHARKLFSAAFYQTCVSRDHLRDSEQVIPSCHAHTENSKPMHSCWYSI